IMGIGPKEAIPLALKQAGLALNQIGWIELNEAFAAQALAVMRDLSLDPQVVNPMGGAIALGHPLGATGAIRAATVVHALRRHERGGDFRARLICSRFSLSCGTTTVPQCRRQWPALRRPAA